MLHACPTRASAVGLLWGRQAGPWCSILLPWEPHSQDFPAGVEKKMVFIESLSAATWTQFAALGGGTEGSGAVGRNQKQPGLGSQGLGPVCAPSTSIPLAGCQAARRPLGLCRTEHQHRQLTPTWAFEHLPVPGCPRRDVPALQKC